tara:strand:+ start:9799 stop:10257 length:459 start_codon:yes stop_codon:yes gene_type:complete
MTIKFITPEPLPTPHENELLIILNEECTEIIQECLKIQHLASKVLRFGLNEIQPGTVLRNVDLLGAEIGDFMAVVNRLYDQNVLAKDLVEWASERKEKKLEKYIQTLPSADGGNKRPATLNEIIEIVSKDGYSMPVKDLKRELDNRGLGYLK